MHFRETRLLFGVDRWGEGNLLQTLSTLDRCRTNGSEEREGWNRCVECPRATRYLLVLWYWWHVFLWCQSTTKWQIWVQNLRMQYSVIGTIIICKLNCCCCCELKTSQISFALNFSLALGRDLQTASFPIVDKTNIFHFKYQRTVRAGNAQNPKKSTHDLPIWFKK